MILAEERKSTIKFGSEFTHVEAKLFHNAIVNKYVAMFGVERSIYAVMLKARDGVTITNVTRDDSLSWLSISLSYACSFAS